MDRRFLLSMVILLTGPFRATDLSAQTATDTLPAPATDRYVLWSTPSPATHIHGLAIGPFGSESLCSVTRPQVVNGIGIQFLGAGLFTLIGWKIYGLSDAYRDYARDGTDVASRKWRTDQRSWKVTHNGLLLSSLGTLTYRVNGLSIGGLGSLYQRLDGVSINPVRNVVLDLRGASIGLVNRSLSVMGLQIGLFNRTHELRGLQVGLWNRNAKRALPLINWSTGRL